VTSYKFAPRAIVSPSRRLKTCDSATDKWSARYINQGDTKNVKSLNITHSNITNLILGLLRPDVIEHLQGYVHNNLQRTLEEYPECLDEPGIIISCNLVHFLINV
jgi:hypothetical protein